MRIGVVVPNQRATVESVRAHLVRLEQLGVDSAWMPGIPNGPDILTLLAVAGQATEHLELGTAIVPTHPRHPVALAAQALTVDDALGGRLTLGIGVSHEKVIDGQLGLDFDRPVRHVREYLSILRPLLAEQRVDFQGETMRTRIRLDASVQRPAAAPGPAGRARRADAPGRRLAGRRLRQLDDRSAHPRGPQHPGHHGGGARGRAARTPRSWSGCRSC